jgi:CRISPR-associated protein Cmr2
LSLEKSFVRAIAFCLNRDGYVGDAEALAKWTQSGEGEKPSPEERSLKVALVAGGATKIKEYVFESARLPEIRGASALLDHINTGDVPQLWEASEPVGIGCGDCIIYAGGGEVLAFAPVCKAQWLADEIERLYARETMVAQSAAVWQAFELNQIRGGLLADGHINQVNVERLLGYNPVVGGFGSLILPLTLTRYHRREGNAEVSRGLRAIAHIETVPFARRCSSCERRAAVVNARVSGNEDRPLCEPCARKRAVGQLTKSESADLSWWYKAGFRWQPERDGRDIKSWMTRFEDSLKGDPEAKSKYAVYEDGTALKDVHEPNAVRDLGEIAQASDPQGFIGFIYADGNDMGRLLEEIKEPTGYATFAAEVASALQGATFAALARNLRPTKVVREGRRGEVLVHPFEILSIGGDDLLLIVPAHIAISLACDIASDVERRLLGSGRLFELHRIDGDGPAYEWTEVQRCHGMAPSRQCKVSLSAGVVIADAHTPIFYLEELASQLLKSAKSRAKWLKHRRGYSGGSIDFLSLKSVTTLSGTVGQFRKASLVKRGRRLYARPYTLAEMRVLIETVELLRRAKFPRGQLYRLRNSLHTGVVPSTVDYRYFLSDDKVDRARKEIEEMWTPSGGRPPAHPWREQLEQQKALETIWPDVVELYDFVRVKEGEDAGTQD